MDSSQSTIHKTIAVGRHFDYNFCRNAIRVLYPQLNLSELANLEIDMEDALM